ncbi:unnamed protein product [Lupinus luteus]|uniref:Uncharacterized protein n=1 Tax=Lupinus luteus TaxID=3873 RepID=A0AAV1W5T8_LUPLU
MVNLRKGAMCKCGSVGSEEDASSVKFLDWVLESSDKEVGVEEIFKEGRGTVEG